MELRSGIFGNVRRGITILLITVWDCGATGVKELGERAIGLMCVKRAETGVRGRFRDRGHILVS